MTASSRAESFDKSEHKPIGSSNKKPAQSAPFMTSGGTVGENVIANKARTRPLAIAVPIAAVRDALRGAGKVGARYPSTRPVIADTGKVSRKAAIAHNATKASSIGPAMATATIDTAIATSEGPSRRNTTVRFIEVDPSLSLPTRSRAAATSESCPARNLGRWPPTDGGCRGTRRPPSPGPRHRLRGFGNFHQQALGLGVFDAVHQLAALVHVTHGLGQGDAGLDEHHDAHREIALDPEIERQEEHADGDHEGRGGKRNIGEGNPGTAVGLDVLVHDNLLFDMGLID